MKLASLATCCALVAFPAAAQQDILDTLNRALGAQEEPRESGRDDYRRGAEEDGRRSGDARDQVDIRAMDDRQLTEHQERLERQARYIARELEDTEDEMQRRNLSRR